MSMLAEQVEVVIGVDTHKHTHTAAVVTASTGAAIDELTVSTDPGGYDALVELADRHATPRVWAIEGTGSYGVGLASHLAGRGERVIELDRPTRTARRNGAKSDPIDAVRAAREALARPRLAEPRARGDRAALSVLLATRRSAVEATQLANHQLHALVVTAPEPLRTKFRGQTTTERLRSRASSAGLAGTASPRRPRAGVPLRLARRSPDRLDRSRAHELTVILDLGVTTPYSSSAIDTRRRRCVRPRPLATTASASPVPSRPPRRGSPTRPAQPDRSTQRRQVRSSLRPAAPPEKRWPIPRLPSREL